MRRMDGKSGSLFSYVDLDARVPARHPLRIMSNLVNVALAAPDGQFAARFPRRVAFDPAGMAVAGNAFGASLFDPFGTAAG